MELLEDLVSPGIALQRHLDLAPCSPQILGPAVTE
jgi:hypothetical protein